MLILRYFNNKSVRVQFDDRMTINWKFVEKQSKCLSVGGISINMINIANSCLCT